MCEAGRIKHHLKHNLWRKESTVLFVGYQAEGTLGRRIRDGADKVNIFSEEIMVRANIVGIDGFSAHADRSELLDWVSKFNKKPKQVILVHGEEDSLLQFSAAIEKELGLSTYIPEYLESIELKPIPEVLASTSQALARVKARTLLQEWYDMSKEISGQIENLLDEEDDEQRLMEMEDMLASLKACMTHNLKTGTP
jgi:metallo-beta-lactamase family protein